MDSSAKVHSAPAHREGAWHGHKTVVLKFESAQAAHAWYNFDAYQRAVGSVGP